MEALELLDDRADIPGTFGDLDAGEVLDRLDAGDRMAAGTYPADALDGEDCLVEALRFRQLLDPAMVISDPDVDIDNPFPFHDELIELRLLLERVVGAYGND